MWTLHNTLGYTQTQLDTINDAIYLIKSTKLRISQSDINNSIDTAWTHQRDARSLAAGALILLYPEFTLC